MSSNQSSREERRKEIEAKLEQIRLQKNSIQPTQTQGENEMAIPVITGNRNANRNENLIPNGNHTVNGHDGPPTPVAPDTKESIRIAANLSVIATAAKSVFIERDDAIDALTVALTSGEHLMMFGKPGTTKSALAHYFAAAMHLNYFWITLNPDTVKEDLMGPISMRALERDEWTRKWAGIATAHIALTDEVGKASNQVINQLIPVMEERKLVTPGGEKHVPVHTVIGASNETLSGDAAAVWDRYTLRVIVNPIEDAKNFQRLLGTDIDHPPTVPVQENELRVLRATVREMALEKNLTSVVKKKMVQLWSEHKTIKMPDSFISDRRWKRLLRCAAGLALLQGAEKIDVEHLAVGRWMLWDHVKEMKKIADWVEEKVNESLMKLRNAQALLEDLIKQSESRDKNNTEQTGKLMFNAGRLKKMVTEFGDPRNPKWSEITKRVIELEQDFLTES